METMIANPPEKPAPEKKESKTGAIIGTIVAILLCGCPGLAICLGGFITLFGVVPYNGNIGSSYYANVPGWAGAPLLCLSIILIAIPVIVGILTLRNKKPAAPASTPPGEPLPPAS
ncbi:MAG: hypothetical protein ABSB41_13230 [Anaerolineales bacterium]|jgi:hypothetical protein